MRLSDLREMAIRGGDLSDIADKWALNLEKQLLIDTQNVKIGNIDDFEVRQKFLIATVWKEDSMIMAAKVDKVQNLFCQIDDVWIRKDFRNQKLFTKFLLFCKIEMDCPKIHFAAVHSDDTYQLLKNGGLKAFKKHWENSWDKKEVFDVATIDNFYGSGNWKLVLENSSDLSKFINKEGFTHTYESLSNAVNFHSSI